MRSVIILALTLAVASAAPSSSNRIIGGEITTINEYPEMAALLRGFGNNFNQDCGGVILSGKSILTAAHCSTFSMSPSSYRVRVGSTFHQTGGFTFAIISILNHPAYSQATMDSDIGIWLVVGTIPNATTMRYASIAGPNYIPADNQPVWATGWGMTVAGNVNSGSYPLRHVQIWTVNQEICRERYANRVINGVHLPAVVTDNMICSGWLDVGGRDQCQGDSGGPLYHNGVVVGICSWGESCALPQYPGVNTRVSSFASWIQQTAQ